ncbi:MAG: TPMT family class I SAM-dependent methyltransferase [Chromatiaceae bacterium]|jgi:SAM-dependent methyltransferase|nr:TPMT family class I SAM-dependent methyltransferase [Chromatiaceae bacterium]
MAVTESSHRQHEWEQRYSAGKTGWDRGQVSPALRHWLAAGQLPAGRVLVPGCGHGHEVAELIRAGCQVTAVDIASQPVMRLLGQLAELGLYANVVQADLLHWQPPGPFDAVYEQTCLCALDPGHWAAYESRLADWLRPGGSLLALFMQTGHQGGPPFDCPLPDMRSLFGAARWVWPDEPPLQVPHPNGLVEIGYLLTRR